MKRIIAIDMIWAMADPWKRSRTMATTSTRVPAAAIPCTNRAPSSSSMLPASPASAPKRA